MAETLGIGLMTILASMAEHEAASKLVTKQLPWLRGVVAAVAAQHRAEFVAQAVDEQAARVAAAAQLQAELEEASRKALLERETRERIDRAESAEGKPDFERRRLAKHAREKAARRRKRRTTRR